MKTLSCIENWHANATIPSNGLERILARPDNSTVRAHVTRAQIRCRNIGTGITIVTTKVGTFEIRILKLSCRGAGEHKIVVVGCGHCILDIGSREIKLELLYYNSNYYSAAAEISKSFKPILEEEEKSI